MTFDTGLTIEKLRRYSRKSCRYFLYYATNLTGQLVTGHAVYRGKVGGVVTLSRTSGSFVGFQCDHGKHWLSLHMPAFNGHFRYNAESESTIVKQP